VILLPQPPECWDYRQTPRLTLMILFTQVSDEHPVQTSIPSHLPPTPTSLLSPLTSSTLGHQVGCSSPWCVPPTLIMGGSPLPQVSLTNGSFLSFTRCPALLLTILSGMMHILLPTGTQVLCPLDQSANPCSRVEPILNTARRLQRLRQPTEYTTTHTLGAPNSFGKGLYHQC
jgi:hypothetical protein